MLKATKNRFTSPLTQSDALNNASSSDWVEFLNVELAVLASLQRQKRLVELYGGD